MVYQQAELIDIYAFLLKHYMKLMKPDIIKLHVFIVLFDHFRKFNISVILITVR